jgi:transposase
MIRWDGFGEIYLHRDPVDLRKSIDGLSLVVSEGMRKSPFSGTLFVFTNRRRNRIKALYWDRTGFALWQKRLEKARYKWPKAGIAEEVVSVKEPQWSWLLEGYDLWTMKAHEAVMVSRVS